MTIRDLMPPALMMLALAGAALAQDQAQTPSSSRSQSPTQAQPRTDQLQPAVQTSTGSWSAPAVRAPSRASSTAAPALAPAVRGSVSDGAVPAGTPTGQADRLQLGATEISGNRELPKLMYIVPWQRPQVGAFTGRPPNSLVDEALTPVDRAVFERQNRYYAALAAGSSGGQANPAHGPAATVPPPAGSSSSQTLGQSGEHAGASGQDEK